MKRRVVARKRGRARVTAEGRDRKDSTRSVAGHLFRFEESVRYLEADLRRGECCVMLSPTAVACGGGAVFSYGIAAQAAGRLDLAVGRSGGSVSARIAARREAVRDRFRAAEQRFERECICKKTKR